MRMRSGFGFSAAIPRDAIPRLIAPPAAAVTLMKFLRVVDVMRAGACLALSRKATFRFTLTVVVLCDELTNAQFPSRGCHGSSRASLRRMRRHRPAATG